MTGGKINIQIKHTKDEEPHLLLALEELADTRVNTSFLLPSGPVPLKL